MTVGKYTRVGSAKGPLVIGGAEKKMSEDSSFTYVPMYSIAGPLTEVTEWLNEHHSDTAAKALQTAYNMKNLKKAAIRKAFTQEVEDSQKERDEASRERQELRQVNLLILVELLQRYDQQRKEGGTQSVSERRTGRKTIRDRLSEAVSAGKVLDVTTMQEKGTNAKRVVVKDNSVKRRLATDESTPLFNVVYNPQSETSVTGVENFLKEYGGFSYDQINEITSAVSSGSAIDIKRTITPVSSKKPSSPLTKRFTSPLRRNQDSSVDDLLEGLNS